MIENGEGFQKVSILKKIYLLCWPCDAVRDEVIGPAGPTTATRMDKFTDLILENTGLLWNDWKS